MLKKIFELIIPRRLRSNIYAYLNRQLQAKREVIESRIPKVPLAKKHMANCKLLLNREIMLSLLKKGGRVAEIGVERGGFSQKILTISLPEILHLVDTWGSERYDEGLYQGVLDKFEGPINEGQVKIHRKLSIEAVGDFEDSYFDWIYVDTDHSYDLTQEELLHYASKVKHGGMICGHDYSLGNYVNAYRYGVIEAVHEFCVKHNWELIYLTLEPIENQSFAIRRILDV